MFAFSSGALWFIWKAWVHAWLCRLMVQWLDTALPSESISVAGQVGLRNDCRTQRRWMELLFSCTSQLPNVGDPEDVHVDVGASG